MKKTTNDNMEISDDTLTLFFDAKESGKSFPEALIIAGVTDDISDLSVLRSLWDMHGNIVREVHNISPSSRLLERTLEALSVGVSPVVTTSGEAGYIGESQKNTITHVRNSFNLMSQMNWKIGAPIAVLAIAVVAVMNMGADEKSGGPIAMNDASVMNEVSTMSMQAPLPDEVETARFAKSANIAEPVSGEIDDLAASLVLEASGDMTLLDDSEGDLSLVTADSQSINDFNTAYDETTF